MVEFSAENTPSVSVAESLRASVAIPLYFTAYKFKNEIPNNHVYVDGGVMYNLPISAFEDVSETLALTLDMNEKKQALDYNNISLYVKQLFNAVLMGQNIDFFKFHEPDASIINIDTLGISITKFDLSAKEKKMLFDQGKSATLGFINVK